uniref:Uncharacterized protein n=1 Tax=Chlamydomonas leiostraca TaxID=1034604 RepID=A0A7S0X1Q8_9CHLO|mmetsp:Transcript_6080/g.15086  ORF Transcript_6080/g.15086 Transcript_6080/m.15086 type:complete len:408 (+) Transcript_6080:93-1316(+)
MGGHDHLRDSAKYASTVLIGNWLEERELRRSALKDLVSKKTTGTLRLDRFHTKMSTALQEVELSKTQDDPFAHFGDVIQLVHLETSSVLACDVDDVDSRPGEEACAATATTQVSHPCARNTFVLLRYVPPANSPLEPDYGDEVLRYGMKVRLAAYPLATGQEVDAAGGSRPLCLFSKPVSQTHFAKYCRNQLVGFTYRNTFDTVWEVVTPDPGQRALANGLEVLAGAPVQLIHCATQKPLLVENQRYPNEFGMEWELTARTSSSKGMKSAMEQTTKGLLKGSLPKSESSDTWWAIMNGPKVASLPAPPPPAPASANSVVVGVMAELRVKYGSIEPLERKLITWSSKQAQLPADELVLLLRQVGLTTPDDAVQALARLFQPAQKAGVIDASALLAALREAEAMSTGRQ